MNALSQLILFVVLFDLVVECNIYFSTDKHP